MHDLSLSICIFVDDLVLWLCNSILSLKKLSNVTVSMLLKNVNNIKMWNDFSLFLFAAW